MTPPEHPPQRDVSWEGPAPFARPGDRCEPWPLPRELAVALHDAARAARVESSLAGSVIVQRSLALLDLTDHGPVAARRLDEAAQVEGPCVRLTEPSRAYLRALLGGGPAHGCSTRAPVQLPMRLSERILAHGLDQLLAGLCLESALAWERAALYAGRTMGEWALLGAAARNR
jgi:hypothetical protein